MLLPLYIRKKMAASWWRRRQRQAAHFSPPFRSVAQQYALANQTLIARWMKAVIIIERKEIAPIMTPQSWPAACCPNTA